VTIINYIDNKKNSIVIHFFCVVISIVSDWGGLIFFLAIIITIMESLGLFFLVAISTVGGGIYFHFDHKHLHNIFFFLLPSFHNP